MFIVNVVDKVSTAEAIMRRNGVRRLPIVDETGRLTGLLSIDDIARRGHIGPNIDRDPLSPETIALTVSALVLPAAHRAAGSIDDRRADHAPCARKREVYNDYLTTVTLPRRTNGVARLRGMIP